MTETERRRFEHNEEDVTTVTDVISEVLDSEDATECECFGLGPPVALLRFPPPPPSPPTSLAMTRCALEADDEDASAVGGKSEHFCDVRILQGQGQGPYTQAVIPSLAVILVCTFLFLALMLVAGILLWKHKRRMRNFLPCKTAPQDRCDLGSGNSVLYEDLTNIRPRTVSNHCPPDATVAPIELLDAKCNNYGGASLGSLGGNAVFIRPPPQKDGQQCYPRISLRAHSEHPRREHCNPAYDEVSVASDGKVAESASSSTASEDSDREDEDDDDEEDDSPTATPTVASEDEFAEDELSLGEFPRPENTPRYSSLPRAVEVPPPGPATRIPVPSYVASLQRNGDGPYRDITRGKCSGGGGGSGTSSLQGSTGGDLCVDFDSVSRSRSDSTSSSNEVPVPVGIADKGEMVRRLPPPPHLGNSCVAARGRNRRRHHSRRSRDGCVNGVSSKDEKEEDDAHLGPHPMPICVISEPNQKGPAGLGPRHDRTRNEFSTFHPPRTMVPHAMDPHGPLVHNKHRRRKTLADAAADKYGYGFARA